MSLGIIKLSFKGKKELIGNAKTYITVNDSFHSEHSVKNGFSSEIPITNFSMIIDLKISIKLFKLIPLSKKTSYNLTDLDKNENYEMIVNYDNFSGKFSSNFNLNKRNSKIDELKSKTGINNEHEEKFINESSQSELRNNWKNYLVPLFLFFVLFKACSGCFNTSSNAKDYDETCLELSRLSGTYEVAISNNEFAMATGTAGIGDVSLKLRKDGIYSIKIWSSNGQKIKLEREGKWKIDCEVENKYKKGEIVSQKFTNKIYLEGFDESEGGLTVISPSRIKGYLFGGYPTLEKK